MSNVTSNRVNEEAIVTDKQGGKNVQLVEVAHCDDTLSSIVVVGKTGKSRRFRRHEDGLFEQERQPGHLRVFTVKDICGGIVERLVPHRDAPNGACREKPKEGRPAHQPKKKGSPPGSRGPDPMKVLLQQELPENAGIPNDGKVISFN